MLTNSLITDPLSVRKHILPQGTAEEASYKEMWLAQLVVEVDVQT
jgi:hypothetical protein